MLVTTDNISLLAILLAAVLLDQFMGEFPRALHPVVWFGTLATLLLRAAPRCGWWRELFFGAILTIAGSTLSGLAVFMLLQWTHPYFLLELAAGAFFLKGSFALRELGAASSRVQQPLDSGDLPAARLALRSLCSRDPSNLDSEDLIGAAIESLAENASDSVVAPLFWFLLLGVPGAVVYRVVNTLDAMIGYRGRFEALGKCAARLDDVLNFLPARLTALLLLVSGVLLRCDCAAGWRILRRDAHLTPSPNGGRPMAAMAGLLGIALAKRGVYVLGEPHHPTTLESMNRARGLMTAAGWLAIGLCAATLVLGCAVNRNTVRPRANSIVVSRDAERSAIPSAALPRSSSSRG